MNNICSEFRLFSPLFEEIWLSVVHCISMLQYLVLDLISCANVVNHQLLTWILLVSIMVPFVDS